MADVNAKIRTLLVRGEEAAAAHLAALPVDYTDDAGAKDLDTDAKRVAAMNATNARVNALTDILEASGLIKTS